MPLICAFINFIFIAWLTLIVFECHVTGMAPAALWEASDDRSSLNLFFSWNGLIFRGYANENSPVMVLINPSTTGPYKAAQELQKQETLIHDIINSSFFVFLISSSEPFVFIPSQLLFSSTTLQYVL